MTLLARILAALAALGGLLVGLAGLVRAAALAGDDLLVWGLPVWWTDLVDEAASWVVGLVAAAVVMAALAYLLLAMRQLAPPRPPATVQVGGVTVKLAALERLVAARLGAEIPGLTPVRVRVLRAEGGWDVAATVDVPANDLQGVRDTAVLVTAAELSRAAVGELAGLDLEVRRFTGPVVRRAPGPG